MIGPCTSTDKAAADYEVEGWKLDFLAERAIEAGMIGSRETFTDRDLATEQEIFK